MTKRTNLPRRSFLKGLAGVPAVLSLAVHDQSHGAEPSDTKQTRHRADWMVKGSYGVMVHWLAPGPAPEKGPYIRDLNRAVDAFDLDRFLHDFQRTGADWLIFTIGQNTSYYASPNATLDRLAGPGHCSRRDLVLEIAERLKKVGKRFIAYLPSEVNAPKSLHTAFAWNPRDQSEFQRRYTDFIGEYAVRYGKNLDPCHALAAKGMPLLVYYNHSCNGKQDAPWEKAVGYDGRDKQRFAQNLMDIVGWMGERYKDKIKVWWFDSPDSLDPRGPHNSVTTDMTGFQFPWERFTLAAKLGFPGRLVTYNPGVAKTFLYTTHQD